MPSTAHERGRIDPRVTPDVDRPFLEDSPGHSRAGACDMPKYEARGLFGGYIVDVAGEGGEGALDVLPDGAIRVLLESHFAGRCNRPDCAPRHAGHPPQVAASLTRGGFKK